MESRDISIIASWIGFGLFHSLLASDAVKAAITKALPWASRWYRAMYNIASCGLTALLGGELLRTVERSDAVVYHEGNRSILCNVLAVLAVAGFLNVCKAYDMMYFAGIHATPTKPLGWSTLHRFVRHPWYSCVLVCLWSRSMDRAQLVCTAMMTLYFFIGSRFEERRLCNLPGDAGARYRKYCTLVPGIVPLPWCFLTTAQISNVLS
jgi:methanethiol S-methyltransferase